MAMGHFSEETLLKFNAMCAAGLDFGEGPVYDFARCIKKDGEIYGISPGEVCKEGKQISDKKKGEEENKGKGISRMSKLRAAFIKKIGREMTAEELEKARNMISRLEVKDEDKTANVLRKVKSGSKRVAK
jgi:hypothetical protein